MKVLILAGGSGSRLWPLSRRNYPKQFLKLFGDESFLQKTVRRNLALVSPEDLFILTHESYLHEVKREVGEIDPRLEKNILLEPERKNTAPAVAFALREIQSEADELFLITPADHLIAPLEKYVERVKEAEKLARDGLVVLFGVIPTRPETGYGYILAKGNRAEKFEEKPNLETAQKYVESGHYFWNAGLFCFTRKTFETEMKRHCPEIAEKEFKEMASLSLDYALMERSESVAMVPLKEVVWSDIGSWENLYESSEKDEKNNVCMGEVVAVDTKESLLLSQNRLLAAYGLDQMVVVATEDAVFVAPKSESQSARAMVKRLEAMGKKEVHDHLTTHRPWGSYTILEEKERFKIKRIVVEPLKKLSLQLHYHRSEHWVVVKGTAKVTLNDKEILLHEGESCFVPKSALHRMENPGKVPLEIIEVQVGEYVGEDDILRLEDVYGRIKEKEAFEILEKRS